LAKEPGIMAGIQTESDGRTWQKVSDPPTGNIASKTSWSGADSFTTSGSYLEVDFSDAVPASTVAVRCTVTCIDTTNNNSFAYYRKYGDSNISATPNASSENSHRIAGVNSGRSDAQVTMYLSSDYKVRITVRYTDMDVYVQYPHEVLL
jgi:hypothetical protein